MARHDDHVDLDRLGAALARDAAPFRHSFARLCYFDAAPSLIDNEHETRRYPLPQRGI